MCVMVSIDKNTINDMKEDIIKNTDIKNINYVNKYDNNYIVKDLEYLYLFNYKYEEVYKVELDLLHNNKNDYELVYKDNTILYMDNYKHKEGVIFKYYDIYTYELIDEVMVGDN